MTDPVAVDITGTLFQLPEVVGDGMYARLASADITDLTTGVVGGTGAFDQLMVSVSNQLKAQYDAGRITGAEYTRAYIEITAAAMQTALQFVLQADNSFWQNQTAQIGAITARVGLEKARYDYLTSQFSLNNLLPAQLNLLKEQAEVQHAQTNDTHIDGVTTVTGLVGEQKLLYAQQIISYKRDAETKYAKLLSDSWITQKTMDEALLPPTTFTNAQIDIVFGTLKTNNGL